MSSERPSATRTEPAHPREKGGSPIFIKTFELSLWLLEHTKKFPKHQRFVLAKRMEEAILSFQDELLWATKTSRKEEALRRADFHLERLKLYNRMALSLRLSAFPQYEHAAAGLDELGRLLGGWLRSLRVGERSGPGRDPAVAP